MFHYNARQLTFVEFPSSLAGPRQVSERSIANKTEGEPNTAHFLPQKENAKKKDTFKKG